MKDVNQFALLGTRRMGPLFTSQFFGAINDNLYKAGLVAMLVFGGVVLEQQVDLFVNVATGIFVLPFIPFSATAGALA
ncbi:MAG: MFS transporter, partial [Pseudomonadales bacterium]|nr:MFS transporter [Pseudomonadales bacterium]